MNKLSCIQLIAVSLCFASSASLAQQEGGEQSNPCTVEPVFHCAEPLDDGGYIAHFGYRTSCPGGGDKPVNERFIEIGDENFFSPDPIDRGQPKVFMSGEHVDDFEAEFSAEELEKGKEFSWTVLAIRIPIDFSKTSDMSLDCTSLSY